MFAHETSVVDAIRRPSTIDGRGRPVPARPRRREQLVIKNIPLTSFMAVQAPTYPARSVVVVPSEVRVIEYRDFISPVAPWHLRWLAFGPRDETATTHADFIVVSVGQVL